VDNRHRDGEKLPTCAVVVVYGITRMMENVRGISVRARFFDGSGASVFLMTDILNTESKSSRFGQECRYGS
jgi:hypothetical protein